MQRRLRRKSGASTAIRPYLGLFDGRCRAVCEERVNSNALLKQRRLRRKYATSRRSSLQLFSDRRCRANPSFFDKIITLFQ